MCGGEKEREDDNEGNGDYEDCDSGNSAEEVENSALGRAPLGATLEHDDEKDVVKEDGDKNRREWSL